MQEGQSLKLETKPGGPLDAGGRNVRMAYFQFKLRAPVNICRLVEKEMRSFALGLTSFIHNGLGQ